MEEADLKGSVSYHPTVKQAREGPAILDFLFPHRVKINSMRIYDYKLKFSAKVFGYLANHESK